MELYKLKAHEIRELIIKKEVTAEEVINVFLKRIEEIDDKLGAFLYVNKEGALQKAREIDKKIKNGEKVGSLAGVPIVIKDNISVTGMQNTCASKILEGYISPYDAYIIKKVKESDAIILGKSNMDEFAMGSSGETSAYKITKNPWDIERVPGGSSSGSAASVAGMEAPISIGTETGGSVRQPASLCGIVGLKPTYGRISRNGIVAFGSTLDQAGPFARDVEDCALLTNVIAGYDEGDFTTSKEEVPDYTKFLSKDIKGIKVGIPSEFFKEGLDEEIKNTVLKAVEVLKENGAEIKEISLPLADYALADYYIIACAEASSNLGRFDGIRYGKRSKDATDSVDIYFKSRSEGFGEEVKRRIMLGTYVLSAGYYDAYYKKALKVRNLIKKDFEKAFNEVDVIISPTSPTTAFKIGEKTKDVLSMYLSDIYTVPVNIAGIPAISVPCGMVNDLPVGLQIIGNYFEEGKLFNVAYSFEQSTEWHKNIANV